MNFVDNRMVAIISQKFFINKATGKKITLTTQPSRLYQGDGAFTLVNGIQNEKGLDKSKEFLGFSGIDCEALIDLGSAQANRPKFMQVLISTDNSTYTEMGITDRFEINGTNNKGVMTVQQKSVSARYIKIKLGNYGSIPENNPGAGNKAWLFVDEIEVN